MYLQHDTDDEVDGEQASEQHYEEFMYMARLSSADVPRVMSLCYENIDEMRINYTEDELNFIPFWLENSKSTHVCTTTTF